MTRQEANLRLVGLLKQLIETHPQLRFSQILYSFGFVKPNRPTLEAGDNWQNEFYSESEEILKRVVTRTENSND